MNYRKYFPNVSFNAGTGKRGRIVVLGSFFAPTDNRLADDVAKCFGNCDIIKVVPCC